MAAKEDFSAATNPEVPTLSNVKSEDSIQEDEEENDDDDDDDDNDDDSHVDDDKKRAKSSANLKPPHNSNKLNSYVLQHKQKLLKYKWRIDLSKTEQFWVGWFQGMSQKFIDLHVSKVLLLANLTMDTALTRAQMEGNIEFIV